MTVTDGTTKETPRARAGRIIFFAAVIAVLLCLAGLALRYRERKQAARPPAQPGVGSIRQITNDGLPKKNLVGDGSRLYFNEPSHGGQVVVQIDGTASQQAAVMPPSLANANILDVSRESELLISMPQPANAVPIWVMAASGASPRRLGDLSAQAATFEPNGKIVFSMGNALYRAEHDGSNPVKFASALGPVSFLRISPDGSRIRFTIGDPAVRTTLWEIHSDGAEMKMLLPLPRGPGQPCCGRWTPDGKYFVYENQGDLWIMPANGPVTAKLSPPVQLTSGPRAYHDPVINRDGRTLYAIGEMRTAAGADRGVQEIFTLQLRLP